MVSNISSWFTEQLTPPPLDGEITRDNDSTASNADSECTDARADHPSTSRTQFVTRQPIRTAVDAATHARTEHPSTPPYMTRQSTGTVDTATDARADHCSTPPSRFTRQPTRTVGAATDARADHQSSVP